MDHLLFDIDGKLFVDRNLSMIEDYFNLNMEFNMRKTFIINTEHHGQEVVDDLLKNLIGETVCVCYTTTTIGSDFKMGARKNFDPQISVQSELEGFVDQGIFRVLIDDNSYSYFKNTSVWSMAKDGGRGRRD